MATVEIRIPSLHSGQKKIVRHAKRFTVVSAGRRFGKTLLALDALIDPLVRGYPCAWFAPTYRYLQDSFRVMQYTLRPLIKSVSTQEKRIELKTGGIFDAWTLEDDSAGRGKRYKACVIDEAAHCRDLGTLFHEAIRPTLTDFRGSCWLLSTPKGRNFFWQAYCRGEDPEEPEWASFSAPTAANPFIDADEIEAARRQLPERVFQQEYLAAFLEDSGGVFRKVRESVDVGRTASEPPVPGDLYTMGVDLARVEDFTVLSVLDGRGRQVHLERLNMVSWARQIEIVLATAERYRAKVVLDGTGVGDPIAESLRRRGLELISYTFTHQSKENAIDRLALLLENGRLRLLDHEAQTNELLSYEYQLTPSRNVKMSAPEGAHDDTVIALALACWGHDRFGTRSDPYQAVLADEYEKALADGEGFYLDDDDEDRCFNLTGGD